MRAEAATVQTSAWKPAHVAGIATQTGAALPVIRAADVVPMPGVGIVWDMWPIERADASTVTVTGRSFWFFLAAPRSEDPDERHNHARIRLYSHGAGGWRAHGAAFPDGFAPGSREWSGSAVLGADGATLEMFFTAAGRRGAPPTFEQRLFRTSGRFTIADAVPSLAGWTSPVEIVVADGHHYAAADQAVPAEGLIRGFRDPGFFRDPADGRDYLLFTGTAAASPQRYDGVVGLARRDGDGWTLLPPLVSAAGLNAELERPHVRFVRGRYYLFWSTQRQRFAPSGPAGPTGLYAMVADRLAGPWRPANGTGLVAGNPAAEPQQAYCWWVTGELDVISFVDLWGTEGRVPDAGLRARNFGGTVAPPFRLQVAGDAVTPLFG